MHPDLHAMGVVIRVALSFAALAAAFFWMVLPTLKETLRQNVFELRRELFRYMVDGHIDPNEPAYRHTYSTMNGVLRRCEKISFSRMLLVLLVRRTSSSAQEIKDMRMQGLARIKDPGVRATIENFRLRVGLEIVRHILMTWPVTAPITLAVWLVARLRDVLRRGIGPGKTAQSIATRSIEALEEDVQSSIDEDDPDRWSFPPPMPTASTSSALHA